MHTAEEELLAWLLRTPQHTALCGELAETDFSSPGAYRLFQAVCQAAQAGLTGQGLLDKAGAQVPSLAGELIKLAMIQPPQDFEPQRDIAACAARVKQNGVQKRLKEVQRQMKTLGAGNVPQELIKEYMVLQTKLKK